MFGKGKSEWNKKMIVIVSRDNGYETIEMKGKRSRLDDGGYFYEMYNPSDPKKTYNMPDIPTSYFTTNGLAFVYTEDMQQFVPAHIGFINGDKVMLELLSGEQKEWYARSLKRDYEKLMDKSWWGKNQTMILFLVSIGLLAVILWFSYAHWGSLIVDNTHAVEGLSKVIQSRPVVPVPKPPV